MKEACTQGWELPAGALTMIPHNPSLRSQQSQRGDKQVRQIYTRVINAARLRCTQRTFQVQRRKYNSVMENRKEFLERMMGKLRNEG